MSIKLVATNPNLGVGKKHPDALDNDSNRMLQNLMLFWIPCVTRLFHVRHRFSAFWLRSKCSICSYQLNIWYGGHVPPSILNWFLQGDEVQELAPASSRVGLALQYRQDRPTSPLRPRDPQYHQQHQTLFYHKKCKIWQVICCGNKAFIKTQLWRPVWFFVQSKITKVVSYKQTLTWLQKI